MPAKVLVAVANQESGFNPQAVSSAGALGLMQLMPGTAQVLGVDPHDTVQNLVGGAAYLRQLYEHYGNWPETLAAYNAGPGNVPKGKGVPNIPETQNYVRSIMGVIGALQ